MGKISNEGVHKACVAGAVTMAEQMGGFVENGKGLVLIHHLQRRRAPGGDRLCGRGGKKLVVDVKLHDITLVQTVIRGLALAVHLDPLVAKTLVKQAGGQAGSDALHKAGKPHAVFVCAGGKLFQIQGPSL